MKQIELSTVIANAWPDMLAFVTGVAGVWLTIKQNIWCWPVALVSVVISFAVFMKQRLYGDMCLQAVYFIAGVYGWVYWDLKKNQPFTVSSLRDKNIPWLLVATLLQALLYYYLLLYFGGDRPLLDGLLTAASLTATYMMTRKWIENWAVWVMVDGMYILLYGLKHLWWFCLLYLVFTIMAAAGWLKWKKQESYQ